MPRDLIEALRLVEIARNESVIPCRCEWTDSPFPQRVGDSDECILHGSKPDPFDALDELLTEIHSRGHHD